MTPMLSALRWDVVLQARNGFYWASAFLVAMIGALLLNLPEAARANSALWVPAILAINLQITTFFFVAGLMLLERDEGTLAALAVSPLSPQDTWPCEPSARRGSRRSKRWPSSGLALERAVRGGSFSPEPRRWA
jgi:hypothetical protein